MLLEPPSPQWGKAPHAVTAFRNEIVRGLGGDWEVQLTAYDDSDACTDPAHVAAAFKASNQQGIGVDISRHAGSDSVLVSIRGRGPFPFEDLAVATGVAEEQDLINLVKDAFNGKDPQPLVAFDGVLRKLRDWGEHLPQVDDERLEAIAKAVATAFEKCASQIA